MWFGVMFAVCTVIIAALLVAALLAVVYGLAFPTRTPASTLRSLAAKHAGGHRSDPRTGPTQYDGVVLRALKNRATNTTHLATDGGQPWCGTRVDKRLLPFEVRRPEEINCDKCRRSQAFKMYDYATEIGEDADWTVSVIKPPRHRPQRPADPAH